MTLMMGMSLSARYRLMQKFKAGDKFKVYGFSDTIINDAQMYRRGELSMASLRARLSEKSQIVEIEIVYTSLTKVFYFVDGDPRLATKKELAHTLECGKDKASAIEEAVRVIKESRKED